MWYRLWRSSLAPRAPYFYLVSNEIVQIVVVWSQLVGQQLQFVEGWPKHYIGRAPLVDEDSVYPFPYCDHRDYHWLLSCGATSYKISLSEVKVGLGRLVRLLRLYCHHFSSILISLGGGASSPWKPSQRSCWPRRGLAPRVPDPLLVSSPSGLLDFPPDTPGNHPSPDQPIGIATLCSSSTHRAQRPCGTRIRCPYLAPNSCYSLWGTLTCQPRRGWRSPFGSFWTCVDKAGLPSFSP